MKKNLIKFSLIFFFLLTFQSWANTPNLNIASLSFSWPTPTALSVFERGDYIWIVFDKKKSLNLSEFEKILEKFSPQILEIPHSKATVLRVKIDRKVNLFVRKEGYLWTIDFIDGDKNVDIPKFDLMIEHDSLDRPYVFIPSESFSEKISVIDPEVGDFIVTVVSNEIKKAGLDAFDFIDFDILNSVQGIAMVYDVDDIFVVSGNKGVSLKASDHVLNLSDDLSDVQRKSLLSRSGEDQVFDFNVFSSLLTLPFNEAEAILKKDIRVSKGEEKNNARLELAKYYLNKGLGFEALAVVDVVLESELKEDYLEKVYSLRAVANFLVNRYKEALNDLSFGDLKIERKADFWRSVIYFAKKETYDLGDEDSFDDVLLVIKNYPQIIQDKIAFIAAQVAVNERNDLRAQNLIDILKISSLRNRRMLPHVNYLIAQNLYVQGYNQEALKKFDEVIWSDSQKYTSLARVGKVLLAFRLKQMSVDDAITELEKVKFSWGEKSFKRNIYTTLSSLYEAKKDYSNAIDAMIEELYLTDESKQPLVMTKLVKTFENLYLNHYLDEVAPLKTLSVYNQYLDYIKKSPKFVDIVISVADRYFAVDLVDNAIEVLERELNNDTISVEQKYKIGTRLALLYLSKKANDKVLMVLDETDMENPQINLANQRSVLRANVYKDQNKYEEALRILDENYSILAVLLRAEIYWLNEDWHLLSSELKLLIDEPVEGEALSDEQVKYIFDWLIALKKSGKDMVITRARSKFEPWFKGTKYYSSFDVLTSQFDYDRIDIKDIENRINSLTSYSSFSKKVNENLDKVGKE
ncbi:MAG: hypothetical protein R3Y43_01100 [Alphaproteobacteria bacterium]